jgi:7-cyano-7-deazaguanine synthase
MIRANNAETIGVLLSGGLDSAILAAHLLDSGHVVQPFYIRSQLVWEMSELESVRRYLRAMASPNLRELVTLELPVADLYRGDHWSITGRNPPNAHSPDEAVFLPGRNALLIVKAAVWCQLNDIEQLALAPLGTSPFADATAEFFESLEVTLNRSGQRPLRIARPFAGMDKRQVMQLGQRYPLELTFSCISPQAGLHCGECNKCAERQMAFRAVGREDETCYAAGVGTISV